VNARLNFHHGSDFLPNHGDEGMLKFPHGRKNATKMILGCWWIEEVWDHCPFVIHKKL
jgi:hypothetical protein